MPSIFLLFGGNGRTGQITARAATRAGYQLLAPTHAECPLEDAEAVSDLVLHSKAAVVVNCAAISGLEACAANPLQAHLVNAVAPAAMALACRHTGARFIHLSTDYVLDGRRAGLKNESAKCRPAGWYAESKREGELEVLEALPEALVARVSWICGNPARPAFVEQALARALRGEPLAAVADKYSLPTDAEDIARVLLALAEGEAHGILHLCSLGEPCSWWECAHTALQEAVACGALPAMPPLVRQELDKVPFFREPRPRHTAMDAARLCAMGIPMPTADECVRRAARRFLAALTGR